jgi:hypothetical protein
MCICIGIFSIVQGFIVKAILPVSWFSKWHMNEEVMSDEEEKEGFTASLRKSYRQSHKLSSNKIAQSSSKKLKGLE